MFMYGIKNAAFLERLSVQKDDLCNEHQKKKSLHKELRNRFRYGYLPLLEQSQTEPQCDSQNW